MNSIATAIQTQIQVTDPGASVTASIVANRLTFSIAGASTPHDLRFGVASDSSNALGVLGLASIGVPDFGTGTNTNTGTSPLGVVQTTPKLDLAGLTGLSSTTTGKITINGVAVSYDTTVDSLS